MQQQMYVWSAKSCPYKTEIPPACHVPNSWIVTSDVKHHLIPKYILSKNSSKQLLESVMTLYEFMQQQVLDLPRVP